MLFKSINMRCEWENVGYDVKTLGGIIKMTVTSKAWMWTSRKIDINRTAMESHQAKCTIETWFSKTTMKQTKIKQQNKQTKHKKIYKKDLSGRIKNLSVRILAESSKTG